MKARPPRELLEIVAPTLARLSKPVAYVGGATTWIYITDPAAPAPRATVDVDVIVNVTSHGEYMLTLAKELRSLGAREDTTQDAPLCRWLIQNVIVDVMPTEASTLGFTNRWYREALEYAEDYVLRFGLVIRVVSAPYFLATKMEAYNNRGKTDPFSSKDLEDIVGTFDGRAEIVTEIEATNPNVAAFIREQISDWLAGGGFEEVVRAHLPGTDDNDARAALVLARMRAIRERS